MRRNVVKEVYHSFVIVCVIARSFYGNTGRHEEKYLESGSCHTLPSLVGNKVPKQRIRVTPGFSLIEPVARRLKGVGHLIMCLC